MENLPLVSIITPSYNQAQYIKETLESIARQTYPNIEHIIIDGQSTDGSIDIIKAHAEMHPKLVRWVSEADRGQADAINKGFGMARGEIVAWLNSDDCYLYRRTISEAVSSFMDAPGTDILYGDVVLIGAENRVLRVQHTSQFKYNRLFVKCFIVQPAVFFRRHVIDSEKLDTNFSLGLDYEFWFRLGKRYNFRHLPRLWAVDRNQPDRKILTMHDQLGAEKQQIRNKYLEKSKQHMQFWLLLDKMVNGLYARIKGVVSLIRLYFTNSNEFAVHITLDVISASLVRQLFKKNRELL